MQTQSTSWINIDTVTELYGIKIKHRDHGWIDAGDETGMFQFGTTKERDEKRSELRKLNPEWAAKSK